MDVEHCLEQPVESLPGRPVTWQEPVRSDRAHFQGLGEDALHFKIVYDVLGPDFNLYMNIQQAINFRIFQKFRENVVALAYPTRTITLADGHRDQESAPKCAATLSAPLCGASCRTDRQAGGRVIR
ncbi:MAG: hypothetical protein U5J82_15490 [Desulfobacterales bacterium]|nr:hypothetical protein [Desulfobacterales bacterium]